MVAGAAERSTGTMFELYGVNKDSMVYRSPPPRRKEVDILEVAVTLAILIIYIIHSDYCFTIHGCHCFVTTTSRKSIRKF